MVRAMTRFRFSVMARGWARVRVMIIVRIVLGLCLGLGFC
jgi:hypothetical protein